MDFGEAVFSEATDELMPPPTRTTASGSTSGTRRSRPTTTWCGSKLPDRDIEFTSATVRTNGSGSVRAYSDVEPGETYLFDRATKKLTLQYRVREKLPREALAPMTAIRYASSDGLEIPAYLTLPKGVPSKNLPLIVVPHGGPWGRDTWGYRSMPQFLANRGYAVLQPNFRASTGYGKKFLNAGNGQWGDKMQDDITWGVKHLVAQGIADPKRVGIMGGSYGGYATLAGVTFTPDIYAAAVAIVAPSNLLTLLETIPPYWEAVRNDVLHAHGRTRLRRRGRSSSSGSRRSTRPAGSRRRCSWCRARTIRA